MVCGFVREKLAYFSLRTKLVGSFGVSGIKAASELRTLANKMAKTLSEQVSESTTRASDTLVPFLMPYMEEAVRILCIYWRSPVIAVLSNDAIIDKFARFTYSLFPEPVRTLLARRTYIKACRQCRTLLVAKLQTDHEANLAKQRLESKELTDQTAFSATNA